MDRILKAARASGSLNLSNRSLREVPEEVYRRLDAVGEEEKWWETVDLQKLILAHNKIESLKEDLRNLSLLTVLNVSNNRLSGLPAAIGELPSLKLLDVSFNLIRKLPEEIGAVVSLVKLDCSSNQLEEIPSSLGNCSDLSELKASNNLIASLPEDLAKCLKLTKVDVEGNKLETLSGTILASWTMLTEFNGSKNILSAVPDTLGSLARLIRLDLHQNRISSIPSSIAGCSSLAELYMGNNMLSSLPLEISTLSQLRTLDLHSNQDKTEAMDAYSLHHLILQLKEFPLEACTLQLSVLDLSNNSLMGLPAEIGKMTTLRRLLLNGNPLRTIRSSLVSGPTTALLKYLRSRLTNAGESSANIPAKDAVVSMATRLSITSKELSLQGLGLTAIPSEVWESGEIVTVDVSKNSIQVLPNELSTCFSIKSLILSKNKIVEWPGAILKPLSNLLCLKLDNNPLRQIPSNGFESTPMLQVLDLSGTLDSLSGHPKFSCLPHLQELYLRRTRLHEVPSDILGLQQLRILDLGQNLIQSIPEGFKNMTSLGELDLSDNDISTLPPELGLLEPSLQVLRIDGNPLRSIRRTVLDRGTKAVLNYLKDKISDV